MTHRHPKRNIKETKSDLATLFTWDSPAWIDCVWDGGGKGTTEGGERDDNGYNPSKHSHAPYNVPTDVRCSL